MKAETGRAGRLHGAVPVARNFRAATPGWALLSFLYLPVDLQLYGYGTIDFDHNSNNDNEYCLCGFTHLQSLLPYIGMSTQESRCENVGMEIKTNDYVRVMLIADC